MAKDLPYYKFDVAEYLHGGITLEDFYTQGVFINICCLYWHKSGVLELAEIKRRVKCKQAAIGRLICANILKVQETHVRITFLDVQLQERTGVSKINSINGSKGGAPIGNKNAIKDKQETTEKQPKTSNIEEKREEEKRRNILFDSFWIAYDKKVNTKRCKELWSKIPFDEIDLILKHVPEYAKRDKNFRKDPERYLKNRTWGDEIIIPSVVKTFDPFNPEANLPSRPL